MPLELITFFIQMILYEICCVAFISVSNMHNYEGILALLGVFCRACFYLVSDILYEVGFDGLSRDLCISSDVTIIHCPATSVIVAPRVLT